MTIRTLSFPADSVRLLLIVHTGMMMVISDSHSTSKTCLPPHSLETPSVYNMHIFSLVGVSSAVANIQVLSGE